MKIIGSRKVDWVILIIIFLCAYMFIIDLTYAGRIDLKLCLNETYWLENLLGSLGFTRCNAIELLKSSLGVALTLVTIILNMGNNIFSHSERKVFGLCLGNLTSENSWLYRGFLNISIVFPILIIIVINLEFCGISYMLLFSCYLAAFCNYKDLQSSYDSRVQRRKVVSQLLALVGGEKAYVDIYMTDFDVAAEDIYKGIKEVEGWSNAWLLFREFADRVMAFDCDKCFMLSRHFFEIVFQVSEGENTEYELIYMKKFLDMMGVKKDTKKKKKEKRQEDKETMEYIFLWGILCSVAVKWDSNTMQSFLAWFADIAERSCQHVAMHLGELDKHVIQKQSAVILVMLEYWIYIHDDTTELNYDCVETIYNYGRNFFSEKNEDFLNRLDDLSAMGKSEDEHSYNAAHMLLDDTRYNVKQSLITTILTYER